jgi:hypothetical protein
VLRQAFQKALGMKKRGFGAAAALALTLTVAGSSEVNLPGYDASFEEILPHLPQRATPYLYSGQHSQNLVHISATEPAFVMTEARSQAITEQKKKLGKLCPAVKQRQIEDISAWFNQIPTRELDSASTDFLDASFRTTALLPPSDEKISLLINLSRRTPDSKIITDYAQKKRAEIQEFLSADPKVIHARASWNTMSIDEKNKFLQSLSNQILDKLLPDKEVEYPKVIILRNNQHRLPAFTLGLYSSYFNEIYLNGFLRPILWDSDNAISVLTHETFHAYQSMLANWQHEDQLKRFPQLDRQALFYRLNTTPHASAIRYKKSQEGYMLSYLERGAFAFQMGAHVSHKLGDFSKDLFHPFQIDINGNLVRVRTAKAPPTLKEQGEVPKACFE